MMVQCPSCKELVRLSAFTARDDVLSFNCDECGVANRVSPGMSRPPSHISAPPVRVGAPPAIASAEAAHEGGSAGSMPPLEAMPPSSSPPINASPGTRDAALWTAWERVHADWGNDKVHDNFIATCQAAESLPFAGTRYKEHLMKRPEDPMAKRGRDRVLAQAIALAQSSRIDRSVEDTGGSRRALSIVVVVVAVAAAGMMVNQIAKTRAVLQQSATDAP